MNVLVTGGAGFIGSNFIEYLLAGNDQIRVVNLDLLTYAGSLSNLDTVRDSHRYLFVHGDVCNAILLAELFRDHHFDTVVHFAAESHVDRSIVGPDAFIQTNIIGTYRLLEAVRQAWRRGEGSRRFLYVSTDEVYGTLEPTDPAFTELTPFSPRSPYSASKAAAHHLALAYCHTYGLPILATCCSNNYGPRQYPEKLVPLVILNALTGKSLPVYGDGRQVRDWIYVADHCRAIAAVLERGRVGETYNVGGLAEKANIDVVYAICDTLDSFKPRLDGRSHREQITHVTDRPGHDRRYAINPDKVLSEVGWSPLESFEQGMQKTIQWYLSNEAWVNTVMSEKYTEWVKVNYTSREAF